MVLTTPQGRVLHRRTFRPWTQSLAAPLERAICSKEARSSRVRLPTAATVAVGATWVEIPRAGTVGAGRRTTGSDSRCGDTARDPGYRHARPPLHEEAAA